MAESDRSQRELGRGVAGPGRRIDVAGVVALTDPGPAAAGVVVTDEQGRMLANRSHYLGPASLKDATAEALLGAARLAREGGLEAPIFRIDDPDLVQTLQASQGAVPTTSGSERERGLLRALRETLAQLPGHRLEAISAGANRARPVALTPLVDWLPERTRRAEGLEVRPLGDGRYEVQSESEPGKVYHVTLRGEPSTSGAGGQADEGEDLVACECADFLFRNIPCKHLFAVARETGSFDRLFHPARSADGAGSANEAGVRPLPG
ncbi:MAG TPA: SWIM zinc finger family protein [Chloroflexota bacterium]|nr:SWIM zinc finger family protein [Chloroflexota bacterium]